MNTNPLHYAGQPLVWETTTPRRVLEQLLDEFFDARSHFRGVTKAQASQFAPGSAKTTLPAREAMLTQTVEMLDPVSAVLDALQKRVGDAGYNRTKWETVEEVTNGRIELAIVRAPTLFAHGLQRCGIGNGSGLLPLGLVYEGMTNFKDKFGYPDFCALIDEQTFLTLEFKIRSQYSALQHCKYLNIHQHVPASELPNDRRVMKHIHVVVRPAIVNQPTDGVALESWWKCHGQSREEVIDWMNRAVPIDAVVAECVQRAIAQKKTWSTANADHIARALTGSSVDVFELTYAALEAALDPRDDNEEQARTLFRRNLPALEARAS